MHSLLFPLSPFPSSLPLPLQRTADSDSGIVVNRLRQCQSEETRPGKRQRAAAENDHEPGHGLFGWGDWRANRTCTWRKGKTIRLSPVSSAFPRLFSLGVTRSNLALGSCILPSLPRCVHLLPHIPSRRSIRHDHKPGTGQGAGRAGSLCGPVDGGSQSTRAGSPQSTRVQCALCKYVACLDTASILAQDSVDSVGLCWHMETHSRRSYGWDLLRDLGRS